MSAIIQTGPQGGREPGNKYGTRWVKSPRIRGSQDTPVPGPPVLPVLTLLMPWQPKRSIILLVGGGPGKTLSHLLYTERLYSPQIRMLQPYLPV